MKRPSRARPPCAPARSNPRGRQSPRRRRSPWPCRAFCRRRRARTGRNALSLRPHAHEDLAATFRHQLVVLIVGPVAGDEMLEIKPSALVTDGGCLGFLVLLAGAVGATVPCLAPKY